MGKDQITVLRKPEISVYRRTADLPFYLMWYGGWMPVASIGGTGVAQPTLDDVFLAITGHAAEIR